MGSIVFPQLYPTDEELTLVDDTTSVFQSSFGAGLTQRVTRIGPRWRLRATFEKLSTSERHNLMAFASAVRGRALAFLYSPRHGNLRGAFPGTELLAYNTFEDTTGWTASSELGLYADANRLRMTRTAVTANRYVYHNQLTGLTSGAAYLFRAAMIRGSGNPSWDLRCGSTAGATTYFQTSQYTAEGIAHGSGTIAATTAYASIEDYSAGRSAGNYQIFDGVSFTRCIRVNGASQSGYGLNVKNLPTSTNGLLLAGDMVSIYTTQWELKRVINALNSDSGGLGYLQFESALRASPSDSAPIAVGSPTAKFILANDVMIKTRPAMYSDATIELMEVIEA
jgi:hypothetical protein